jgi:RHS repeat-associated protein
MKMRISKNYTWQGGAWVQTNELRRVYDGMLVIQERDSLNLPRLTYTRGKDLSGFLAGAGGIGGLLAFSDQRLQILDHNYYHADGNGNVTCLTDTNQTIGVRYLYDPFGNTFTTIGTKAALNKYRFSSKEAHEASGLVYFGYRWYVPGLQRWPNRDPITEPGFAAVTKGGSSALGCSPNLFLFVANDPISKWDYLGLDEPGCDIGTPGGGTDQCKLRCCFEHDTCIAAFGCTQKSWLGVSPIGLLCSRCARCHAEAAACYAACVANPTSLGPPTTPFYYCPNGGSAGTDYNSYAAIPPSCWTTGVKPPLPTGWPP